MILRVAVARRYLDAGDEARQIVPTVLRTLMSAAGISSADIANVLGISKASLSERLSGKTRITADELATLANFFGVDPGIFFKKPEELLGFDATLRSRWDDILLQATA